MDPEVILVLKLAHDKWFIDTAYDTSLCYDNHRRGIVCSWTKIHPPVSTSKWLYGTTADTVTLHYMREYGIENVRGGTRYRSVYITPEETNRLKKDLGLDHKCTVAINRPLVNILTQLAADSQIKLNMAGHCYRCGRGDVRIPV